MDQQSPSVPSDGSALKTSEKGTKKSGKVLPIILILVALAGIGFGVYGLFFKPSPACSCPNCIAENAEKTEEQPPQETPNTTEPEKPTPQETPNTTEPESLKSSLDLSRFKDGSTDEFYTIAFTSTELHSAEFRKNSNNEWLVSRIGGNIENQVLNLSGEPAQIFIGAFGVDDGGAKALFLLQDGTVEYFRLYNERGERNTAFTIEKYEGLKNIIRFHQTYRHSANRLPGGGMYTVVAEDKDGYYYDLAKPLN